MTFGQTDALARAVVEWLNNHVMDFCTPIAAQRRFRLIDDLTALPDHESPAAVDVFPGGETGDREGISTAFASSYAIHIVIQQQLSGASDKEAQCAQLAQLRSEIIEGLKLRAFDLTATAVHPVKNVFLAQIRSSDKGLYNLSKLMELHVFESDTILVFKAAC